MVSVPAWMKQYKEEHAVPDWENQVSQRKVSLEKQSKIQYTRVS